MLETKLYVRYMLSLRCVNIVKQTLRNLSISFTHVESGLILLPESISESQLANLSQHLSDLGFALLDRNTCSLIDQINDVILDMVYYSDAIVLEHAAQLVSQRLGYDPEYLATIFTEVKGTSISQFVDSFRIERIKELLLYDEVGLENMAAKLNYTNAKELKSHFKKATGLTTSFFITLGKRHKALLQSL